MGNTFSYFRNNEPVDLWWGNKEIEGNQEPAENTSTADNDLQENFVEEYDRQREKRKIILERKRLEIKDIREELHALRLENIRLRNMTTNSTQMEEVNSIQQLQTENENLKKELEEMRRREGQTEMVLEKNKELRISVSEMQSELQHLNSSILDFEQQKLDYKKHVVALKDVIKVSKELLLIRENELKGLKEKMTSIECAFKDKEAALMSNDLRREYEKQLANIRVLRDLYEERSQTHRQETTILRSNLTDKDKEIEELTQKMSELTERVDQVEKENSDKYDVIKSLESNLGLAKAETKQYQAELAVINQLFSHILLAFNNSPDLDLDKLLKQLEENHDLLKDIVTNEISSEVSSALPKVLLDLVNRISKSVDSSCEAEIDEKQVALPEEMEVSTTTLHNFNSPAEIAENLPKVWKVLIELLSHQSASISEQDSSEGDENRCYKTVTTPKGPSLVLSVSKTFFRLKELIIEKKSLEKDMNNLKQLNSHLECRLQEQEKRFDFVSSELSKTWSFVSKLQKEHHLLHTQEQILRYELAQKRKLLNELKDELEYSREKWQEAREKNSKTEREWLILRKEFAARKKIPINEDGNNSVESGYSDEREESSDDEPGYETDISESNLKSDGVIENETECSPEAIGDSESNIGSCTEDISTQQIQHSQDNSILDVIQNEISLISTDIPGDNALESEGESTEVKNSEMILSKSEDNEQNEAKDSQGCSSSGFTQSPIMNNLEDECNDMVTEFNNISSTSAAICNKVQDHNEIDNQSSNISNNIPLKPEIENKELITSETCSQTNSEKSQQDETKKSEPSTSSRLSQSLEERLALRDERLKRLEGQCKALVSQVTSTSNRSNAICNKLEDLHEIYGEPSRNSQLGQRIPQNNEPTEDVKDGKDEKNG